MVRTTKVEWRMMSAVPELSRRVCLLCWCALMLNLFARPILAQTCYAADDMDASTRTALETTAKRYFDFLAKGDSASLRQNAIASLASSFSGIENAVKDNQSNFSGAQ